MLTHLQIWNAVDSLAERHGLSSSGLARKAGLDSTTFNRSKRIGADGRLRWPSTESIAKALEATGDSLDAFMDLIAQETNKVTKQEISAVPQSDVLMLSMIDTATLQRPQTDTSFFDKSGAPIGNAWEDVIFPDVASHHAFIIDISDDAFSPEYRRGDQLIVSTKAALRRSDKVLIQRKSGELSIGILIRETAQNFTIRTFGTSSGEHTFPKEDIAWCARLLWASQ
jgi:phage repressor protein C with HTH and peptisase S24 domain